MRFFRGKSIPVLVFFLIIQILGASVLSPLLSRTQALTLDVYGQVAPLTSQLVVNITASKSDVHQDDSIVYTIKYSTLSASSIPVTIEASWSQGTVSSSPGNHFDVVDYELGSGSQGFQNTSPVYDPNNRTLSWYIPAFSQADGEQTVTFRLKTNASYQQSSTVTFSTSAVLISTTSSLPSTVTHSYTYLPPTASSSPTPSASPTPATSPAASSKPPVQQSIFQVISATLRERTDTTATFHIQVSHQDQLVIRYGTDPKKLTNTTVLTTKALHHFFSFSQLQPNTRYYFTIEPTQPQFLRNFTPRLVTFMTAQTRPSTAGTGPGSPFPDSPEASAAGQLAAEHITIVSQYGNILNAAFRGVQTNNSFGFARGTLEYNFSISQSENADKVSVAFGKLSTFPNIKPNTTLLPLGGEFSAQFLPSRTWSARLSVPPDPGTYMIILRREDRYGSLGEESLGILVVSSPLTLQDEKEQPLAGIRMDLERINDDIKLYEPILPSYFAPKRGFVSDENGNMFFPPMIGHYRATFSHPLYVPESIELQVDQRATQLPTVTLERRQLTFWERIKYFLQSVILWCGKKLDLTLER